MKRVFAKTKNVERFYAAMDIVRGNEQGRVGMALVYGEPGTGKSECCIKYTVDNEYPCVRATAIMTKRSLLAAIVAEMGEVPEYRTDALFQQALNKLTEPVDPPTLIVDEIDYLVKDDCVEVLRDLNDLSNAPIVLVGMHQADKKLQRFRHLVDRFSVVVKFDTFDASDIKSLASQICEVPLDDSAIEFIHKEAKGKFRRTMVWFSRSERIARTSKIKTIMSEHLKAAKKRGAR